MNNKYISVFLVSLFILTGCGNGDSSAPTPTVENNQSTEEGTLPTIDTTTATKTKGYLIDSPLEGVT